METPLATVPAKTPTAPLDTWARKRIPDDSVDNSGDELRSVAVCGATDLGAQNPTAVATQSKRFKGDLTTVANFESPRQHVSVQLQRRLRTHEMHFREAEKEALLSPITEIAYNLSDATLNTPPIRMQEAVKVNVGGDILKVGGGDNTGTPLTGWKEQRERRSAATGLGESGGRMSLLKNFHRKLLNDGSSENCSSNKPKLIRDTRRLNMNEPCMEMHLDNDELSFYDDDGDEKTTTIANPLQSQQQCPYSPRLDEGDSLLPEEESSERLQIVSANEAHTTVDKPQQNVIRTKTLRVFNSLSSGLGSLESSMDDEYLELIEMESLEAEQQQQSANLLPTFNFPTDLNSLISGEIKEPSPDTSPETPQMRRPAARRCLSMTDEKLLQSPSTTPVLLFKRTSTKTDVTHVLSPTIVERNTNCASIAHFKQPESPTTKPLPKVRTRDNDKENFLSNSTTTRVAPGFLRKCMSMNDADILSALTRSESVNEPDLIGDFSKPFALPLMPGRHCDLKSISSDTVARLINGDFADRIANYKIIDCRYPYEYEGGHIRGAQNLYTQEQIIEEFLNDQANQEAQSTNEEEQEVRKQPEAQSGKESSSENQKVAKKHSIIIFHCEFSSERGPRLSRFLRNNDRARNTNSYPTLAYPEIYLLHNGYKEFYETHAELCEPTAYRPMLEPAYIKEYHRFRTKSKSWNGDGGGASTSRRKKSRSRLLL